MNKPVVVGCWAHYSRDGLTVAPKDREEYFEKLTQLIGARSEDLPKPQALAEKYAYWYYNVYHLLNNTDLHSKPFAIPDDSWFLRVPQIQPTESMEFQELMSDFMKTCEKQIETEKRDHRLSFTL